MALSFSEIRRLLCDAFTAAFPNSGGEIEDVYQDRCIIRDRTGALYEVPYRIDDQGHVITGDLTKVRRQVDYVRVAAAAMLTEAPDAEGTPDEERGYKWHVQIAVAGIDTPGRLEYPLAVLHAAAPLYNRSPVFALNDSQHMDPKNPKPFGNSIKEIVGWIGDAAPNARGVEGNVYILKTAKWLRDNLVDTFARGKQDLYGLSHEALGIVPRGQQMPQKVERIVKVREVDVVYDPALGGEFMHMAAAGRVLVQAEKEDQMRDKLLTALKTARPEEYQKLQAAGRIDTITEDELLTLLGAASSPLPAPGTGLTAEDRQLIEQTRITAAAITLDRELSASGLPTLAVQRLRKQFEGTAFEATTLQAAIKAEKEYLDNLSGSGVPSGSGQVRVPGNEEPEKIQAAFDLLLGVRVDDRFRDVAPMRSLRAAYTFLTGDEEVTGRIERMSRDAQRVSAAFMQMVGLQAAYDSASFTYALGNSMYRRLVQDYREVNYYEDILVSNVRNARDFKTIESILITYPGDLPDINPETGDYQEETAPQTDSEVSYHVNQKGKIITITRKTVINDDISLITRLLSRRGHASRRTHAKRIWNKFIDNATYKGDSKAVFHADHANLGAVTLTNDATGIQTLTNRKVAMFNQTAPGSGEKIGLRPMYEVVPIELESNAYALNQPWPIAGTMNPNAWLFGQNNERIITHPLFTDTNDWMLVADKNAVEIIEVAYLNGQKEPELFVADNPLMGQVFVADKIQYKERHEYECEIVDYRGVDKSVCT